MKKTLLLLALPLLALAVVLLPLTQAQLSDMDSDPADPDDNVIIGLPPEGDDEICDDLDEDEDMDGPILTCDFVRATGSVTTVTSGIGGTINAVVYDPSGPVVYVGGTNQSITAVDPGSGLKTPVIGPFGSKVQAMAIAPPGFGAFGGQIITSLQNGDVLAVDPSGRGRTQGAASTVTGPHPSSSSGP